MLFDLGRDMQAAAEVNKTVSLNEAEGHCPTLAAYARFAMKYDKTEEALRALLKAVVLDQGNKAVRAMLAKIISSARYCLSTYLPHLLIPNRTLLTTQLSEWLAGSGYEELLRQLPGAEKSAAALAFLATICKVGSGQTYTHTRIHAYMRCCLTHSLTHFLTYFVLPPIAL